MNIILTVFLLYISTSIQEWFIHKYMMHSNENYPLKNIISGIYKNIYKIEQSETHINHHSITNNENKVSTEDEGMLYGGYNIPFTTLIGFIIYFVISKAIKYEHTRNEYLIIFITWIGISSVYYFLWNILHPTYHEYKYSENYENIKDNFIYKYLEKYHMIHHLNKGEKKCNFNIILPFADFILGTYKGCVDNRDFCNSDSEKNEKEKELCDKQIRNIKLHPDIEYCKI
jgi:hypothetical protein